MTKEKLENDVIDLLKDESGAFSLLELEEEIKELAESLKLPQIPEMDFSRLQSQLEEMSTRLVEEQVKALRVARAVQTVAIQVKALPHVVDFHLKTKEKESHNQNFIEIQVYPWGIRSRQRTPVLGRPEHEMDVIWD